MEASQALEVDVVITDLVMPYNDAIEFSVEIRRHWPASKVVAMSGVGNALRVRRHAGKLFDRERLSNGYAHLPNTAKAR